MLPGDLVLIRDQTVVPCDLTLLRGSVIVNESMLTGESAPIVKTALALPGDGQATIELMKNDSNCLFQGTKVIQLKPGLEQAPICAMVTRTGFLTSRGRLIASILFPVPSSFRFLEQSYKFVFSMFLLSLIGVGVAAWQLEEFHAGIEVIVLRSFAIITIVVPPALPMGMYMPHREYCCGRNEE